MKRLFWPLLLTAICALALAVRCWNLGDVFVAGRIYFADADCYSRMTRAALVAGGRGPVIRHHEFENFPHGATPHTTALLDWLIVAGKGVLDWGLRMVDWTGTSVLRGQGLDLSGALVSPLLGLVTCAWLGWWARRQSRAEFPSASEPVAACAWTVPLLFAISPVLVHGTVLGRPDHQSLLIFLVAVALGAEWQLRDALREGRSRRLLAWSMTAAAAWALALWVSWYEPLVLLAIVVGLWLIADRRRFTVRECRAGWIAFGVLLTVTIVIDGWRVVWPDTATRAAFAQWQTTIGELRHLDLRTTTLFQWLGAACVLAPIFLGLAVRRSESAIRHPTFAILALLSILLALTLWQLRWGYFLALVYVMSLPWQFGALRLRWPRFARLGPVLFLFGLWPVARAWDTALFPSPAAARVRQERARDAVQLRALAEQMRPAERAAFLAPWWLSPPLAYWSGQPGVAGSSHQALPGTMETARFFLAPDAASAEAIARRLGVKWIVTDGADADGSSRLVKAYAPLLHGAVPESPWGVAMHERGRPQERVSVEDLRAASPELRAKLLDLAERAQIEALGSAAFSCVFRTDAFKLFRLNPTTASP